MSKQWITPDFIAQWHSIVQSAEMDPITLAQDSKDSWATHISATIVDQTTQTSSVLVKLGPTTDQHTVLAHLVLTHKEKVTGVCFHGFIIALHFGVSDTYYFA